MVQGALRKLGFRVWGYPKHGSKRAPKQNNAKPDPARMHSALGFRV